MCSSYGYRTLRLPAFPASCDAAYAVLATVSRSYPPPQGRFPCITHPCATKVLLPPFDLHVLGTPPAFVLSQDQTLSSNLSMPNCCQLNTFFTILTVLFTEPSQLLLKPFNAFASVAMEPHSVFAFFSCQITPLCLLLSLTLSSG